MQNKSLTLKYCADNIITTYLSVVEHKGLRTIYNTRRCCESLFTFPLSDNEHKTIHSDELLLCVIEYRSSAKRFVAGVLLAL